MNLKHEFNRISHLFHNGVENSRQAATDFTEQQAHRARNMRKQVDAGTRSLVSAEEAMVRHVRENPALYLVGAAIIIGALIAKLLIESSQRAKDAPLM